MKQIKKYKPHYLLPLLVGLSIGLFWLSLINRPIGADATTCPALSLNVGNNQTLTGTVLSGPQPINITASSSVNVSKVIVMADGMPIGRAVGTSGNSWNMPWMTDAVVNGGHTVSAQAFIAGGPVCPTQSVNVYTNNPSRASIAAAVSPLKFAGMTNEAMDFNLGNNITARMSTGAMTIMNVAPYTVFKKIPPPIGILTPADETERFRFSAGTVAGTGAINVIAYYGGLQMPLVIPVTVYPQLNTTTGTNPATTTTSSGSTTSGSTTTTTSADPKLTGANQLPSNPNTLSLLSSAASIEASPKTKDCTIAALSAKRYEEIKSGKSRPTAEEFEQLNKCFADRNYVLPTTFVPIPPAQVKQLPENKAEVDIQGASNATKKSGTGEITTLKFSGKAKPNSLVLLYVHSEPLVLSTTADKNGDWSYQLEDPLESGKHEVYAVVDKGNGSYQRSSLFSFVIAKASASPVNPKGYSLKIAQVKPTAAENNRSTNIYLFGTVGLVVLVLGALFIIVETKHHRHKSLVYSGETDQSVAATTTQVEHPTDAQGSLTPVQPETPEASPMPEQTRPTAQLGQQTQTISQEPTNNSVQSQPSVQPPQQPVEPGSTNANDHSVEQSNEPRP